jgi:hypothetical protein
MAAAVYLLLRGIDGTAAHVGRIALIPFVVFYSAWETLQGIANGVLVDQVNALPESSPADRPIDHHVAGPKAKHPDKPGRPRNDRNHTTP